MLNVVLDTNILHQAQSFNSTEMKKLISLSQKQVIQLYIPEVVLKELKSQKEDEIRKLISSQEKTISELKKLSASRNDYSTLVNIEESFSNIKKSLIQSFDKHLSDFKDQTNFIIIKNSEPDIGDMLDLYFSGKGPFRSVKSRQDIPDCFIYLAIKTISKPHVICCDNTLKAALEKDKIPVYSSVSDFIEKNKKSINKAIEDSKIQNYLCSQLQNIKKLMITSLEKVLEYKDFVDENMVSENNEGTIEGTPSISSSDIQIDKTSFTSDRNGFCSFDFYCEFTNLVEYYIFKADYYCMNKDDLKGVGVSDWNEHYFLAEDDMNLLCRGSVTIHIQGDLEFFNEEEYMLDESDITIDNVEVSLSVK